MITQGVIHNSTVVGSLSASNKAGGTGGNGGVGGDGSLGTGGHNGGVGGLGGAGGASGALYMGGIAGQGNGNISTRVVLVVL